MTDFFNAVRDDLSRQREAKARKTRAGSLITAAILFGVFLLGMLNALDWNMGWIGFIVGLVAWAWTILAVIIAVVMGLLYANFDKLKVKVTDEKPSPPPQTFVQVVFHPVSILASILLFAAYVFLWWGGHPILSVICLMSNVIVRCLSYGITVKNYERAVRNGSAA